MSFSFDSKFVKALQARVKSFGFNGMGETVYMRTYSREIDSRKEEWYETVIRVITGTLRMQEEYRKGQGMGWDELERQTRAQKMAIQMFDMKWLPPGRGLWAMGSPITSQKHLFAALNNCAFVSTKEIGKGDRVKPFIFLMDMSMLGVGVGFDTLGENAFKIVEPGSGTEASAVSTVEVKTEPVASAVVETTASVEVKVETAASAEALSSTTPITRSSSGSVTYKHVIADDREGWVLSVRAALEAYFLGKAKPVFDYSQLRPEGVPLKTFGGTSSGPKPLKDLHETIDAILSACIGQPISSRIIVDIMNIIGRCVVAGNVRRSAEIALGRHDDEVFQNLKNYTRFPERASWGWTSNNSILADVGMDYKAVAERIASNGEPGIVWLKNAQDYGRMADPPNHKDYRVAGVNPCSEQSLESYELCCLVEILPHRCKDFSEFQDVIDSAFTYAKTVTLGKTHWAETNEVLLRNRRIGVSVSGLSQFIEGRGIGELQSWLSRGYAYLQECDKKLSEWFAIPRSIKLTTIKPSGSVSLLPGATPGMHYSQDRYYIRRVTMRDADPALECLRKAGYPIEESKYTKGSSVVEFPIDAGPETRPVKDVSMWEQLTLAALLQAHWSDNQVSVTVTFKQTERKDIARSLEYFQYQLKSVSFLPYIDEGQTIYAQMPYESITREEYERRYGQLQKLDFTSLHKKASERGKVLEGAGEVFCDSDRCLVAL